MLAAPKFGVQRQARVKQRGRMEFQSQMPNFKWQCAEKRRIRRYPCDATSLTREKTTAVEELLAESR